MIDEFTILGERCSGTNFLQKAIQDNFNLKITWDYGYKHFFGHSDLSDSHNCLFLCIVRHPLDWINSFFRTPHHLAPNMVFHKDNFLKNPVLSFYQEDNGVELNGKIIKECFNVFNHKQPYKNIFELREATLVYMKFVLKHLVSNYCFIKYEDFCANYQSIMSNIHSDFNLSFSGNSFKEVNTYKLTDQPYDPTLQKINYFKLDDIKPFLNIELERLIGYKI